MATVGEQAWAITTLIEAADVLVSHAERRLKEVVGVSLAEKEVLFRLSLSGGAMRMSDLARALLFSPSGATRLIDRMIDAGLVERAAVERDRRATAVRITRRGRARFRATEPVMQQVVAEVFAPFVSDEDVAALTRILAPVVIGNGRWADRAAGADFEAAIVAVGQPSVRTRS